MPHVIDGEHLDIATLVDVARNGADAELSPVGLERIIACRAILDRKLENGDLMYGVTTGIGELCDVVLTKDQTRDFQRYLVYSHAAGYGKPALIEDVRAAMISRVNVLSKGYSGVRPIVPETMLEMLRKGVTPVMCRRGSVGASGDLSPMAQMALVLIGEGEAFYEGERMPGAEAMKRAGVPTIVFEARDGLACINGSNVCTGMGALMINDAHRFYRTAELAAALSFEGLKANITCCDERLHKARGYAGAVRTASELRRLCDGSDLLKTPARKVQDAYSIRSTPQIIGSAWDALEWSEKMILTELNGVGDNPLFFEDDGGTVIPGANFQGTPIAFALEMTGIAVTTVATMAERRTNRLLNPALSEGLPAFLTKGAGMFSGLMLTQYTAGSLICESRILAAPAATGSIPAAADQEDFVSMSMTTALKTRKILRHCEAVLGIELLCAAQALEFRRPEKPGALTQKAWDKIREHVEPLEEDRPLNHDVNAMAELVRSGDLLE
jgi:histidine ammonia-lyase